MGQYFRSVFVNPEKKTEVKGFIVPWDYDNGAKLMEHSYIGNSFTETAEFQLRKGGKFYKSGVIWAGDYADTFPLEGEEVNHFDICNQRENELKVKPRVHRNNTETFPFLVNHTKKTYVDKRNGIKDADGWMVHPLPLLTCNSNGRGGGDYRGEDGLIGLWSGDSLSLEKKEPKGYKEQVFDLPID